MQRRLLLTLAGIAAATLGVGTYVGVRYYDRTALADRAFRQGNQAFAAKDYATAEERFTTVIRKIPEGAGVESDHKRSVAFSRRSEVRAEMDRFDEALEDFAHALELEPRVSVLYLLRGKAYLRRLRYDEAEADLGRCLELNATNTTAAYYLGVCAERRGDLDAAAARYRRLVEMDPERATGHAALSRVLRQAGDPAGSADFADKARRLDPKVSFEVETP